DPAVRLLHPALKLVVQVTIAEEGAAVDEVVTDIGDRSLHLPLGFGSIGATGSGREAPVGGEAEELLVANELTTQKPEIPGDDRLHLVKQQLLRHAAEDGERLLEPVVERAHVLARIVPQPEEPRIAEDH